MVSNLFQLLLMMMLQQLTLLLNPFLSQLFLAPLLPLFRQKSGKSILILHDTHKSQTNLSHNK